MNCPGRYLKSGNGFPGHRGSPVASIPGTVTVPSGARAADFPIVARSVPAKTCAIITATSGTSKARALLKVFPPA